MLYNNTSAKDCVEHPLEPGDRADIVPALTSNQSATLVRGDLIIIHTKSTDPGHAHFRCAYVRLAQG